MKIKWPVVNLFCTLISLTGIYVINSGITSLSRIGEVSKKTEFINLTLPPGFVFGIWGIIYLGFVLFALYQLLPKASEDSKFADARPWISISILLNLSWILFVGFDYFIVPYILQWIMMIISIHILFLINRNPNPFRSYYEKMLAQPFVLYAGWLTVAMIPYTTDVLLSLDWTGEPFTREFWAITVYIVAACIVYFAYRSIRYSVYLLPLAWAFYGLFVKFSGLVSAAAGILSVVLLAVFVLSLLNKRKVSKDYV